MPIPLGHRGAWLQWGMGDVGDRVDRLHLHMCRRQLVLDRSVFTCGAIPEALAPLFGMPLEIIREITVRAWRPIGWRPGRPDRRQGERGGGLGGRDNTDEIT